jgi:hypothetical protein
MPPPIDQLFVPVLAMKDRNVLSRQPKPHRLSCCHSSAEDEPSQTPGYAGDVELRTMFLLFGVVIPGWLVFRGRMDLDDSVDNFLQGQVGHKLS